MAKSIKILPAPDLVAKPIVNFTVEEHRAMVWNKGYDAIIESAVRCPCRTKNNDNLSDCQNCRGTGWVFLNPTKDRIILSSINYDTKQKDWSEEKLGTISVTAARRSYLSYMDRITVIDSSVIYTEVLFPKEYNGEYFSFTIYDIDEVVEVFQFSSSQEKLVKLEEGIDFTVSGNKLSLITTEKSDLASIKSTIDYVENDKIILLTNNNVYKFSSISVENPDDDLVILPDNLLVTDAGRWLKVDNWNVGVPTLSLRYKHKLQYHVLDNPHIIRNSYRKDQNGRDELQLMPIQAVARISHYVVDSPNFDGSTVFDNSYQEIN